MDNAKPHVHYSDRESSKMVTIRKRHFRIHLGLEILLLMAFLLFAAFVLLNPYGLSVIEQEQMVIIAAISFPMLWYAQHDTLVMNWKNRLMYGVVLADDVLRIFKEKIQLSAIKRAEVLSFNGSVHFLAIEYDRATKRRTLNWTVLLTMNDTEDIYDLCNRLRGLKGWSSQTRVLNRTHLDWRDGEPLQ